MQTVTRIENDITYKVKLCPFCGGEPFIESHHRAFIGGQTTKVAFVRCSVCNARTERFKLSDFGRSSHSRQAVKRAVESWNRRVETKKGGD